MFGIGWEEAAHVSGNPNEPLPRPLPARLWGCPLKGATHDRGGQEGTAIPYMDGLLGMADHLATSWE